jgi:hypothetical protein
VTVCVLDIAPYAVGWSERDSPMMKMCMVLCVLYLWMGREKEVWGSSKRMQYMCTCRTGVHFPLYLFGAVSLSVFFHSHSHYAVHWLETWRRSAYTDSVWEREKDRERR